MTAVVVKRDALFTGSGTWDFIGQEYGVDTSFIWIEWQPGQGVRLHSHPYKEIFIVIEGTSTYRVGDETLVAHAGDIIVAPADVPHGFTNTGTGRLVQIDIHLSPTYATTWLED